MESQGHRKLILTTLIESSIVDLSSQPLTIILASPSHGGVCLLLHVQPLRCRHAGVGTSLVRCLLFFPTEPGLPLLTTFMFRRRRTSQSKSWRLVWSDTPSTSTVGIWKEVVGVPKSKFFMEKSDGLHIICRPSNMSPVKCLVCWQRNRCKEVKAERAKHRVTACVRLRKHVRAHVTEDQTHKPLCRCTTLSQWHTGQRVWAGGRLFRLPSMKL
ncbi:hypothetical protein BS78_09G125400 [Paspalum vaginatum]|nr:hypothetical protein BS78_09G125400 [Paspalum vaginatum]